MEAVYRWKGDKRFLLYEEGNQILAQVIGTGRTVQWGSLCRDYHSCGVSLFWEDEIYVAYVNTENVLMWDKLFAEGMVATQYVDLDGNPTMDEEWNVNGSYCSIEGITSPDGRIFGKMAHAERRGDSVAINIYGDQDLKIFESGVEYFK